jgi:integrase/recombinase XerD
MTEAISEFLDFLSSERAFSKNSYSAYQHDLEQFSNFLAIKKYSFKDLSLKELREFFSWLRKEELSSQTLSRKLSVIRQFYKFLLRDKKILKDPSELMMITRENKKLPQYLSIEDVDKLLESLPTKSKPEIFEKAFLELWYATGLRVSEIISIKVNDIDWEEKTVKVTGKRGKERIIPVHDRAIEWCLKYKSFRPVDAELFFTNKRAKPITRQAAWKLLKDRALKAGIAKKIWPHLIRHTFATHVLQGGADLRAVQELLGHQSIQTTEIYTHLDIENLKVMQLKYHPRS